jgi:hypothetical protein
MVGKIGEGFRGGLSIKNIFGLGRRKGRGRRRDGVGLVEEGVETPSNNLGGGWGACGCQSGKEESL